MLRYIVIPVSLTNNEVSLHLRKLRQILNSVPGFQAHNHSLLLYEAVVAAFQEFVPRCTVYEYDDVAIAETRGNKMRGLARVFSFI